MVRLRKSGVATGGESDDVKRTQSESNQTGKKKVALSLCFIGVCLFLAVFGPEQSSTSQLTSLYQEAALDQVQGQQQSTAAASFKKRCPIGSTIVLLFPHVNKAGGRTVEATFGDLSQIASERRHRYISARPRSKTHKFDIVDHHKPYPTLALRNQCYDKSSVVQSNCEQTTSSSCKRWVFTLRNPIKRTISAFYTTTGRPVPPRPPHVPGLDASSTFSGPLHFPCAPGSKAAELLQDPNSSINDWASLPYEERLACKGAFNTHVKYLAPDKKEGSLQQFEAAKARLSAMSWFGILERWSESLHLFSYALGTDLVHFTPTYNVNSYDNKPSLETLRVLQAHNAMDMELFEFASKVFKERLEAMRQDKLDPFYFNELPFTCDTTRICWDKSTTGDSWEMGAIKDLKATKGSVICTDKAGCTRNDMSASSLDQITLPLPGTKLEDYLAQSSNSKKALAQVDTSQKFQVASEPSERNPRWPTSKCLGSFFILGARKGGTTSLYTYIAQHPKFAGVNLNNGAQAGELLFLHLEGSKRNKNLRVEGIRERYDDAFLKALVKDFGGSKLEWKKNILSGELMTGESSVANGPGCAVPELMQTACGNDIRLVYLVRNPIDRIVSQYKMRERKGTLDSPQRTGWTIEQHVIADLDDIEGLLEREGLSGSWWETQASIPCLYKNDYENSVWSSMYIVHLKRWTQLYSDDKLQVIRSEEMFLNPAATVRSVMEFIGLDSKDFDAEEIVVDAFNTAPQTTTRAEILSDATEKRLAQFFVPYNDALSGDFGINVQEW